MTLRDLFTQYKPKAEFTVMAHQSTITGKFIACVFKKGYVQTRFSKEPFEGAIKVIAEEKIEKYLSELKPYIDEKEKEVLSLNT